MNYDLLVQIIVLLVAVIGTYYAVKRQNKDSIDAAISEAVSTEQRFSNIESEYERIKQRIFALENQDRIDAATTERIFDKMDELKASVMEAMTRHLERYHIGGKNG